MTISLTQWGQAIGAIHAAFYERLVGVTGCGAFDGGCLIVARALQRVTGGELGVVATSMDVAQHAVVCKDDLLWDYDGPLPLAQFLDRFNRIEVGSSRPEMRCTIWRPMRDGDLPDAVQADEALEVRLSSLFRRALSGCFVDQVPGECNAPTCDM